ncbi:DUF1957 domain-containing protein [Bacillota bacterium LX-D]|nr:DUF1957 domain-containing protein [Bacillota bacterium LX-D]
MSKGYLAFVLHAHLPYVRHKAEEFYIEERWLFEALNETYIPLLQILEKLRDEEVPYRLTMSFSPTLISMLNDQLLRTKFQQYLETSLKLAQKEIIRTKDAPDFQPLAKMYYERLQTNYATYVDKYSQDILKGFKLLQELGNLEIITSSATHSYLPLFSLKPEIVQAQLAAGIRTYENVFNQKPPGIWLPECGFFPELDVFLAKEDLGYFFVETHGLLFANPRPRYGTYVPIRCPGGAAAFARDHESSVQVWSSTEGYPGDPWYREFYRDIGYDLDLEYIKDFIHPDGIRLDTGFKYYRITGEGNDKKLYLRERALEKAHYHAKDFLYKKRQQLTYLTNQMEEDPIIVAPYDAELFGHWWFEGPEWLEHVIRQAAAQGITLITPSEYLAEHENLQPSTPCASSWGNGGYNSVWLDKTNNWIYKDLYQTGEKMINLANIFTNPTSVEKRALNQAAREILLSQSSDWAFIMKTGTMVDYAKRRTLEHLERFRKIYDSVLQHQIDEIWLKRMEKTDNIFPDIDYRIFASNSK